VAKQTEGRGITWTDETWNPIRGCSRVSEGCRNCYAESVAYRFSGPGQPYEGLVRIGSDGQRRREWNGQVRFIEKHLRDPLKWKEPRRIFVNSMSDLFHESLTDEQIDRIFGVMMRAGQHTFQVLTKRPGRMAKYLSAENPRYTARRIADASEKYVFDCDIYFPMMNVHLGTSVENRKEKHRIDALRGTPAEVRFLSLEPLLEDLGDLDLDGIHWVIVGGESGPGARPMHPGWVRSIRDQCVAAGVPFFFKQWGEWTPGENVERTAGRVMVADWFNNHWTVGEEDLANDEGHVDDEPDVYRVGKKGSGAMLDGREWREFPQ
jgi:protein gp37